MDYSQSIRTPYKRPYNNSVNEIPGQDVYMCIYIYINVHSNPLNMSADSTNPDPTTPSSHTDDSTSETGGSSLSILYITLVLIVAVLIIWILLIIFSPDDALKILSEMSDASTNLNPVTDTTT